MYDSVVGNESNMPLNLETVGLCPLTCSSLYDYNLALLHAEVLILMMDEGACSPF